MFADELRRAIEVAPRITLPQVTALLWRAFGAGQVTEAEVEALSNLIEARKIAPSPEPGKGPGTGSEPSTRRSVGSRPRTDASLERRRRWVASGRLPPQLAASFTMGEAAVLSVVAAETVRRKDCRLAVGHLAAIAGVSETTVRNALREAQRLGFVTVEERRVTGWRNDTNIVRVVCTEWLGWLRLAKGRREGAISPALNQAERTRAPVGKGGGCNFPLGTPTHGSKPGDSGNRNRRRAAREQGRRPASAASG